MLCKQNFLLRILNYNKPDCLIHKRCVGKKKCNYKTMKTAKKK